MSSYDLTETPTTGLAGAARRKSLAGTIEELDPIINRLDNINERVQNLTDRVNGPRPRPATQSEPKAINESGPSALIQSVQSRRSRLVKIIDSIEREVTNLEETL